MVKFQCPTYTFYSDFLKIDFLNFVYYSWSSVTQSLLTVHIFFSYTEGTLPKSTRLVQGDRNAQKLLECLSYVAGVYGEQVILLQYIPCIIDMVRALTEEITEISKLQRQFMYSGNKTM